MCASRICAYFAGVKLAAALKPSRKVVLGIDPGTQVMGYALVEQIGSDRRLLALGVHRTKGGADEHPEKLRSIFSFVAELIRKHKPDACALESAFFGKNVQSMLKLGRAQGVVMASAMAEGVEVFEYAPKKVKMSVTGRGNASKEQMYGMLSTQLDFLRMELPLDASDAVAVALCHLNQSSLLSGGSGTRYSSWKQFVEHNPGRR